MTNENLASENRNCVNLTFTRENFTPGNLSAYVMNIVGAIPATNPPYSVVTPAVNPPYSVPAMDKRNR